MVWLFIGLVCFLLVVGCFTEMGPIAFTIAAIVLLGALAFLAFVIFFIAAVV